jgi:CDP-glycerol glycerophosphotransferase (TagB/SpsB family)
VVFEFALLRRPVVLFTPDLDEYAASRSFYRPFEDYAIGPVTKSADELASAISGAEVDDARLDRFLAEFCGALDGRSSERIVRELLLDAPATTRARRTDSRTARLVRNAGLDLIAARAARLSLTAISTLMLVIPRRRKVTMLTREHNRPPVDFVLLRDALRRQDPTVRVTIVARMVPGGVIRKIGYGLHILVELYHVASSRVLIVDGYSFVASAARHGEGLTIVQMWHALGALKKFGLSILGRSEGRDPRLARAMRMHRNYDIVITSAERCRPAFAEAFGTDIEKIVVAPLPRVDRLRDPIARARARARFARLYPDIGDKEVVLYAPTFRASGKRVADPVDPLQLTRALSSTGRVVITKLHPLVTPPQHPELRTAPGMSTQDLMLVADVFVTDYSSAVFEAAVAGVPSYLLAPDLDHYLQSRDFYLRYPDDLGLPLARSVDELVGMVSRGDATQAQVDRVVADFVDVTRIGDESSAADRIAAILVSNTDR